MALSGDKPATGDVETTQRLDKWLWFARMAKTRSLAQQLIADGKVRVNRDRVVKVSQAVKSGDLITVSLGEQVRLLKIAGLGVRRGPAPEAVLLYEDLAPPQAKGTNRDAVTDGGVAHREAGSGRPTKRDRRQIDKLRSS